MKRITIESDKSVLTFDGKTISLLLRNAPEGRDTYTIDMCSDGIGYAEIACFRNVDSNKINEGSMAVPMVVVEMLMDALPDLPHELAMKILG
mgnify:CR=1 FL=1